MSQPRSHYPLTRMLVESLVLLVGVVVLEQPWGIRPLPIEPTLSYTADGSRDGVGDRLHRTAITVSRYGSRGFRTLGAAWSGRRQDDAKEAFPVGDELGQTIEGAGSAAFTLLRYPGRKMAVAFRASRNGMLRQITLPWKRSSGYGAGAHGIYTFELQTNGPGNFPSGDVVARMTDVNPGWAMDGSLDGAFTFPISAELHAGRIYHLVITNTDRHPDENWSSPSGLMTRVQPWDGTGCRVAVYRDGDWHPWSAVHNPWNTRGRNNANGVHCPLLLTWNDVTTTGDPYGAARTQDGAFFYESHRAGEYIQWEQASATISRIGLSVRRIGVPAGPLLYHLEENGNLLDTGTLATAAQVHAGNQTWVYARLSQPVTLRQGESYRLWFESPGSTRSSCYFTAPVYGERSQANWLESGWGGTRSHYISGSGDNWSAMPHGDLSFSLR